MKAERTSGGRGGVFRRGALASLWLFASLTGAQAVSFQDYFTNRETLFTTNGTLLGDNSAATFEFAEPQHGNKPGGHSLWVAWVAPTNGVATFDTHGSGFDTLMSAYTLSPTNGTQVTQLHEESRNDDDPGFAPTSLIQIGAIAGREYEIAVDGYKGATGAVVLNWSFLPASSPPPIIVSTPNDQAAKQGDPVTLTVNMIASGNISFDWYFNGIEDTNQTSTNYVISSLQDTNVGRYQLRVTVGNGNNRVRFFTDPVEVQINSEGFTNTLADDKLFDATDGSLEGGGNSIPFFGSQNTLSNINLEVTSSIGVVRGYNGSQVFNTTFATIDPAEPPHCGVTGGASYWLMYQPPANGTMTLDTIGSSYDTVMEAYTFNGTTLTSYSNLISLACDNDGVSFHGPSRVTFQVVKTRQYVVVVDGVNGSRGTAWLNYVLNTNLPAQPPTLQSLVTTQTVTVGSTVTLAPSIGGELPMKYAWKKDGTNVPTVTIPHLQMANVTTAQTGNYSLLVTNDLGTLTVTMPVHVVVPPVCAVNGSFGNLNLTFPTISNFSYTIQQATNVTGPWTPWAPTFSGTGGNFSTNIAGLGTRFFRIRID